MSPTWVERLKSGYDLKWLGAAIGCTLAVLFLSHLPQDPTPEALRRGFFHIDKVEHFLAYAAITLLFTASSRRSPSFTFLAMAFLAIAGIGAFDELTQPLFHRYACVNDFIADAIGILLGAALHQGARRLRRLRADMPVASSG